jgi:superfamily II DNA or RNA helicase
MAVVAPTGAGKTAIGALVIARYPEQRWVWLAHTRDLVEQSAAALEREFPGEVGIVMAGLPGDATKRIQICSVQTLLARDFVPPGWVVLDEMHHYGAEEWQTFAERFGDRPALGLTATPERADGVGLRGLFHDITVAAHYSELIRGGYIVSCRTLRPTKRLRGVAQDPVTAYLAKGEGRYGFTFCRSIEIARDTAAKYTAFGVPAECVDANTGADERRERIAELGKRYQMLTSVYALTEGVDVPGASVCVLARGINHPSGLLQMAGRVLRDSPGKTDALLLDLPGVTWDHGLPHEDREYSLDGIQRKPGNESLRVCQQCGYTELSGVTLCSRCGFKLPPQNLAPRVHNVEIAERAGDSDLEKTLRLSALIVEAKRKGWADDVVADRYKQEFGARPKLPHDPERKLETFMKFKEEAGRRGLSFAYAAARFKALYGAYPPRSW